MLASGPHGNPLTSEFEISGNQYARSAFSRSMFSIKGAQAMGGIIYLVGLVVIVLFILSLLGLR